MRVTVFAAAIAAALATMTGGAHAQSPSPAPSPASSPAPIATTTSAPVYAPPDYGAPGAWLCLPGRADACAIDQTATIVAADGTLTRETFHTDPAAPIDCFYVYPTVSTDPTPNSDMTADPAETYVVAQQFARLGAKCRTFAPLYRQVTLAALRALMTGQPVTADRTMAYADVLAAWRHYLAHDNNGRGVVLVGHSQGASILTTLIANEIDARPVQAKIVSAILLGSNVAVPRGQTVGGVFKSMPTCARADQTGCVISYVSFRDTSPPPLHSRFGTTQMNNAVALPVGGDLTAACVNPAALLRGGVDPALHAYLTTTGRAIVTEAAPRVWATGKTVDTPFVSTPGLLTAHCVSTPTHTYLSVHVNADPADPRTDTIAGDVVVGGNVQADWGLHLIDVNLTMGDLVDVVGRQAGAYTAPK